MKNKCSIIFTLLATVLSLFITNFAFAEEVADDSIDPEVVPSEPEPSPAPILRISAFNAGYKDDNSAQNYDFIELEKTIPDALALDNIHLVYTNSAGNEAGGISFSEHLVLNAEHLVLMAHVSPQSADYLESPYIYNLGSSGLASTAGKLQLYQGIELLDEVCWGKLTCTHQLAKFSTSATDNHSYHLVDGEYITEKYYPDVTDVIIDAQPPVELPSCAGVVFSEVYSYYAEQPSEQFIELHNPTASDILLDACALRYKNNDYPLSSNLRAGMFYVYQNSDLVLTKDPAAQNTIELIDASGDILSTLVYYHGQKKGTSYALHDIGTVDEAWRQTYFVTPGLANIYQQFQTCPEGKIINEVTGNCINEPATTETLPTCPEGKYLNTLTNRCKNLPTIATVTACKDGYYRNPATGRCKKIATQASTTLMECQEGYERNPETNRCRKIRENTGTDYAPVPVEESNTYNNPRIFIATGALIIAILAAIGYLIYQFRRELKTFFQKLFRRKGRV